MNCIITEDVGDLIDLCEKHNAEIEPLDFVPFFTPHIPEKWIDLAKKQWLGISSVWIDGDNDQVLKLIQSKEFDALTLNYYCKHTAKEELNLFPVELVLRIAQFYMNHNQNRYVLPYKASLKNLATEYHVKTIYESLEFKGENDPVIEAVNADFDEKTSVQNQALWFLGLIEKTEGESDFTRKANRVLKYGLKDFKILTWFAYKLLQDDYETKAYKIPKKPLELPESKTIDLPGLFQLRRIKKYHGFFGASTFIIAADENENGVCFSMNPYKLEEQELEIGDFVLLRGAVSGLDHSKKFLELNRVKVTKGI